MRLRNLIFALFLMVGAMGAVSCVSLEGDKGSKGDPGQTQCTDGSFVDDTKDCPKVEEEEVMDNEGTYAFLEKYGVSDGKVACTDDVLDPTSIDLPGEGYLVDFDEDAQDILELPDGDREPIKVKCASTFFGDVVDYVDREGDDMMTLADEDIILVKTLIGIPKPEVERIPASDFNLPMETKTTKKFIGGPVYAEIDEDSTSNTSEVVQRTNLHTDCGRGTAPPMLKGEWRGVNVVEETWTFTNGQRSATPVTNTVRKVCVKLDAVPGSVKCYYNNDNEGNTEKMEEMFVGFYDGMDVEKYKFVSGGASDVMGYLFMTGDLSATAPICDIFSQ